MGDYNGVLGGVSTMVMQEHTPWWLGAKGTIDPTLIEGREITPQEAYELALDWDVNERDVFVDVGEGTDLPDFRKVEGKKALVRSDTKQTLGIHSDSYGVTQNDVLRDFCEALKLVGNDVQIKSAGSLFDGKVTWMLAKLGEDRAFDGGVHLSPYYLVSDSHDGSGKLEGRDTATVVECMNTFEWAIKGSASTFSLRHTSHVEDYVKQAQNALRVAYNHYDKLDAEIAELLATDFSRDQYVSTMVPAIAGERPVEDASPRTHTLWEKRVDGLLSAWKRPDQQNINGTAWGAVMAVNSYEAWSQTVRGCDRLTSQARRAIKGDYPLTQKARTLVMA